MIKNLLAGSTGLLLALAVAAPAPAATVTVRVEGASETLVREVAVEPSDAVVVDKTASGGTTCEGNTAGGALELATGGDWSGPAYEGFGQAVDTIKGEQHVFGSGAYWSYYLNNSPSSVGLCDTSYVPADGDEILLFAACEAEPQPTCASGDPLDLTGPATARPGEAFTVHVDEWTSPFGETPTSAPSAGATVSGGGTTATTNAAGDAAVTLATRGPVDLVATKGGRVREAITVCVTDGADGYCGTTAPDGTQQPDQPQPVTLAPGIGCQTTGDDGLCGTRDRTPAEARITGIEEGQRFRRSRAPRRLTATVPEDPNGLHTVKLGLSRKHKGRCSVFSGKRERFRRAKCGHKAYFRVGDRPEVDYLLPKRLPRGRYVLDVIAIDGAFNRDRLARGRNRVVFHVR